MRSMAQIVFWLVLLFGFVLPLAHVALSPKSGSWTVPAGSGCPIGPRIGWIVIVLFIGPFGWLLYMRARRRHALQARLQPEP